MAARKNNKLSESHKDNIQVSMLIKLLADHAHGVIELNTSRIRSIEILLNKSLPNLQSIEQKVETTVKKVVSAQPMNLDDWEQEQKKAAND